VTNCSHACHSDRERSGCCVPESCPLAPRHARAPRAWAPRHEAIPRVRQTRRVATREIRPKDRVAAALTRLGSVTPQRVVRAVDSALNYVAVGRWMHERGFAVGRPTPTRYGVFDAVAERIGGARVVYLEFGVLHGDSMRKWSSLLTNPSSELHGFDKFEGLPELWQGEVRAYSAQGVIPSFNDPRVRIHVGWFDETLPKFEIPEHDRLIINIDADLYSSTTFVLTHLGHHIVVGDILYFDEFQFREHELKAFDEHLSATGYRYELVAHSIGLRGVAFERVQ
jgi:hypothetical protein